MSSGRSLLFIGLECGFICRKLIDVLERKNFSVEYFEHEFVRGLKLRHKILFYINLIAEFVKRRGLPGLVIGAPVSFRLFLWLNIVLFLIRPRRLVLLIPPSERHVGGFRLFLYSVLISMLTLFIRISGIRVLLVYTTPYEKQILEGLLYGESNIFYPVYSFKPSRKPLRFLREFPPIIFIYALNEYQAKWLNGTIVFLEELGVKPLIILGFEEVPRRCISHPLVACIYMDEYDRIIGEVTLVLALHVSPESSMIVVKAVSHGKPVIIRRVMGIGRVFEETGLIVYEDSISPENIATAILNVINNLDRFRHRGLRAVVTPPKTRYFEEILVEFLT